MCVIFQFEENEKKRMKAEQQRQEMKHKKQWEELVFRNESSLRELEQLQVREFSGNSVKCDVWVHVYWKRPHIGVTSAGVSNIEKEKSQQLFLQVVLYLIYIYIWKWTKALSNNSSGTNSSLPPPPPTSINPTE